MANLFLNHIDQLQRLDYVELELIFTEFLKKKGALLEESGQRIDLDNDCNVWYIFDMEFIYRNICNMRTFYWRWVL